MSDFDPVAFLTDTEKVAILTKRLKVLSERAYECQLDKEQLLLSPPNAQLDADIQSLDEIFEALSEAAARVIAKISDITSGEN